MIARRTFRTGTLRLIAIGLAAACAGCAQLGLPNPFATRPQPARPTLRASRASGERPRPLPLRVAPEEAGATTHRGHAHPSAHPVATAPARQEPAAPAAVTTVTLGDEAQDRVSAEHLLDDAGARLARIDRAKLRGDEASSYSQASGFVSAARRAIDQHDYLAASSLARKASVISDQLADRMANP